MRWFARSLRGKLIAACVLVQLAAATLVVFVSSHLLQQTLLDFAGHETRQVVALLEQAIATPLAQRDYATLQQTLDLVRSDEAINYLVLWDHRGKVVAASGWDIHRPLPERDGANADLERADTVLHQAAPLNIAGQQLGRLDLGLSTVRLRRARAEFLQRGIAIGVTAVLLSMFALAAIAYASTRHLARLAHASQRVAEGDFDVHVPVRTADEIGRLSASFNAMATALKQRVAALEESESQQRAFLAAARAEQARLTTLLGAMQGGIMFVDGEHRIVYANASFARIWSLAEPAPGQPLAEIVPQIAQQLEPNDAWHVESLLHPVGDESTQRGELRTRDGRIVVQRMQPVAHGGCIWFHEDITRERQTEQRAHEAMHDPLTRLLNRRGLLEALQPALAHAAARGAPLALLFIDLDDFKHANDVGGHRTGDDILVAVARALAAQLRKGELVARHGGDEFAILCPGIGPGEAGVIAGRLVEAISQLRFPVGAQTLRVGCSIGVATYPVDARSEDSLIACADTAMYQAKQSGKNGWAVYRNDPSQSQAESVRMNWNARIHRALQERLFVLHFQPVYATVDLRVAYHEALVRMVDEVDPARLISPAEFIGHAERSGKIRQLDHWVFEACVALLSTADAAVALAANLSARSLEDSTFPGFLRDLLQHYDVDPRRLRIELTETSALRDPVMARQLIDGLRRLGCAVHLDDFGSGFSSFAQLKLLDVDAVKIDGGFIRDLRIDPSNRLFVASMIDVARSLHKTTVAEHVEDAATLDVLRTLNVDFVQGFHLGRPSERLVDGRSRLRLVSDAPRRGCSAPQGPAAAQSRVGPTQNADDACS